MSSIEDILAAAAEPGAAVVTLRYLIAFTPRSGSSYLCERLESTGQAGIPREILNKDLMPIVLQQIPARTPEQYLERVLACRASPNGVSGFKSTWFQFAEFSERMPAGHDWGAYRWIYLRREDLAAQAVSLYRAVRSRVFHTNVPVDADARRRMQELPYAYPDIAEWYRHLADQETAWEDYFAARAMRPLRLSYEQIQENVAAVVQSMFDYFGSGRGVAFPAEQSVFEKLGDETSQRWADRFAREHAERSGQAVRRAAG